MGKHLFGISTLIMSIALLIWSIGETFAYPQGPNVSLGSNPIVSFKCFHNTGGASYTVPNGSDLIITDIIWRGGTNTSITVAGQIFWPNISSNVGAGAYRFTSGISLSGGTNIACGGATGLISGYLVHQ